MMLGLSIVKLSLCLYQKCCTLTAALCQHLPLRIFLVALCQCTPLYHCAKACPYTLVALCQSVPLLRSGTVPMYAYHSGTMPMYTYTSIFLWNSAKACLYTLVALCQSVSLYPSGTVSKYTSMVIFLLHCANTYLYDYFPVALLQYLLIHVCILIVLKV